VTYFTVFGTINKIIPLYTFFYNCVVFSTMYDVLRLIYNDVTLKEIKENERKFG
jgi:hypothetical protein